MDCKEYMKAAESVTIHVVGLGIKKVDLKERPDEQLLEAACNGSKFIDDVSAVFSDEVTFEVKRKTTIHRAIMKYSGKIVAVREFPAIYLEAGNTLTVKFNL